MNVETISHVALKDKRRGRTRSTSLDETAIAKVIAEQVLLPDDRALATKHQIEKVGTIVRASNRKAKVYKQQTGEVVGETTIDIVAATATAQLGYHVDIREDLWTCPECKAAFPSRLRIGKAGICPSCSSEKARKGCAGCGGQISGATTATGRCYKCYLSRNAEKSKTCGLCGGSVSYNTMTQAWRAGRQPRCMACHKSSLMLAPEERARRIDAIKRNNGNLKNAARELGVSDLKGWLKYNPEASALARRRPPRTDTERARRIAAIQQSSSIALAAHALGITPAGLSVWRARVCPDVFPTQWDKYGPDELRRMREQRLATIASSANFEDALVKLETTRSALLKWRALNCPKVFPRDGLWPRRERLPIDG